MDQIDKDALAFLIAPEGKKQFLDMTWEKSHKVYKATKERKAAFEGLLAFSDLCSLLDTQEEKGRCLEFVKDVHVMRYIDGEREDVEKAAFSPLERGEASELFEAGATFQVHQPQRFNDNLWRVCAALESQLGCLVGCNAYITPPSAQGLAPHYDDVELWVCQTSGKKKWTVYGALPGQELPPASSSDIPRGALPPPALEVTLAPGDVLYLPRGHVHEAQALAAGSSHVTISTYQQWSWKELLDRVMGNLAMSADGGPQLPHSLRAGVPPGFVFQHAVSAKAAPQLAEAALAQLFGAGPGPAAALGGTAAAAAAAGNLAQGLRDTAAAVEAAGEVVALEAQAMGADFMRARLPPHPAALPAPGPEPSLTSRVCCRTANGFMLVLDEAVDGRGEEDSDEDGSADGDSLSGSEDEGEDDDDHGDAGADAAEAEHTAGCNSDGNQGRSGGSRVVGKGKGTGSSSAAAAGGKVALGRGPTQAADADASSGGSGSDAGSDEDSEGLEAASLPFCVLLTCLHNDRSSHMIGGGAAGEPELDALMLAGPAGASSDDEEDEDEEPPPLVPIGTNKAESDSARGAKEAGAGAAAVDGDMEGMEMPPFLHIPMHQAEAITVILGCVNGKSVPVAELPLEDDEEKLDLARALYSWGMLCTLPAAKRPLEKKQKLVGAAKRKSKKHKAK